MYTFFFSVVVSYGSDDLLYLMKISSDTYGNFDFNIQQKYCKNKLKPIKIFEKEIKSKINCK